MEGSNIKVIGKEIKYEIDMYKILKESGQANVFKAKRLSDGKILIAKQNKEKALNWLAEEETKRVMAYDHKHIVKCVDGFIHGFDTGLYYVAIMEYCDGGDLEDFISEHGGK